MRNCIKITAAFILGALLFSMPVQAASVYHTRVRVIQAGKGPAHVDPPIRDIVNEMQPVFKYTRFKLINEKTIPLAKGQEGRMTLPGKRNLVIVPGGMSGNRINYSIQINAGGKQVFRTKILLKNNDSITIGGPRVPKGVILLDIRGSAR